MKGPLVSGPWLEVWGGNANALPRPSFYTSDFWLFSSCGTMFPWIFLLQVMSKNHKRRLRSLSVDRVDPSPHDLHPSTCVNAHLSNRDR